MVKHYKYHVVGSNSTGVREHILSKHNTKKSARESAKKFWHKGYSGVIYTRKKVTPNIQKRFSKVGIGKKKYHYIVKGKGSHF